MLKIQCPRCGKSFLWTDEMPVQNTCPNPDCKWSYDVTRELGRNIDRRENRVEEKKKKLLVCPVCQSEIRSRFSVCPGCGRVLMGDRTFRKGYFFIVVCLILIALSVLIKYG
ncbi:MAG: hypothetical protein QMD11_02005 [Smithella sp.]|nr:hypothetical protein [Smithella sp.]